jgi:hypothetical protein
MLPSPALDRDELVRKLLRGRTVLSSHSNRWGNFPELAGYACWLEELLGLALPEEAVALASLEFRHEPAGLVDPEVDRLHADGSYLRAVYTLAGPTTIYREGRVERSVPEGQTLLMTAIERARAVGLPCTLHRRPSSPEERALIVCSFGPRPEDPRRARIYRDVSVRLRRLRRPAREVMLWVG